MGAANSTPPDPSASVSPLLPPREDAVVNLNPFHSDRHPFGYGLTDLGRRYLSDDGSLDSDVGHFLSTLKGGGGNGKGMVKCKTKAFLKEH
ncbi:hypothetical protein ACHAWF_005686 [Thalassiosira exigua]